jgi:cellulose synthase/poly-beta-1,6-N-acetylglucosamine synthase-like glycosyltransferase
LTDLLLGQHVTSLQYSLLAISLLLSIPYGVYVSEFVYLAIHAGRYQMPKPSHNKRFPVTIQLPIHDERYVINRLIDSCIAMASDYGSDLVQILVLDDSADDTVSLAESSVAKYHELGFDIEFVHREPYWEGFKPGKLRDALRLTKHPFIALFDADFIPNNDFLRRAMPYFDDPEVAMVQCRWTHVNRDYNLITKGIAIGYDGHHMIEQPGRFYSGLFTNFNGSGGVIRASALEAAGGWQTDTLAEDLDASIRMRLLGWKMVYLRDIEVPGEVPPTILAVKRQQERWACGTIRVWRKLGLRILRSDKLTLRERIEAFIHISQYAIHPIMFLSFVIAVIGSFFDVRLPIYGLISYFNMSSLAGYFLTHPYWIVFDVAVLLRASLFWLVYVYALRLQHLNIKSQLPALTSCGLIGFGLSFCDTIAVLRGLFGRSSGIFLRTPKYKIEKQSDTWKDKKYRLSLSKTFYGEVTLAALAVSSTIAAIINGNIGIIPIVVPYLLGYMYLVESTLRER